MSETTTAGIVTRDGKPPSKMRQRVEVWRTHWSLLDHEMKMNDHYFYVSGSLLAGAATYYGFLAFFPILALGFAIVGFVTQAYPGSEDDLTTVISQILPGLVSSSGEVGTISMVQIQTAKATAGIIGFLAVLYSALGWLSGIRYALLLVFQIPVPKRRKFVVGKLYDLATLSILGIILVVSVSVSGIITGAADWFLGVVNLDDSPLGTPLLWVVGVAIGLAVSTVLFFVMFKMLGRPEIRTLSVWEGAVIGALGFEILKTGAALIIEYVGGTAFAPLALALTLVVWINYFSRLVIYSASWAFVAERNGIPLPAAALPIALQHNPFEVKEEEVEPLPELKTTFDAGSAMVGGIAGFVAGTLFWRRPWE